MDREVRDLPSDRAEWGDAWDNPKSVPWESASKNERTVWEQSPKTGALKVVTVREGGAMEELSERRRFDFSEGSPSRVQKTGRWEKDAETFTMRASSEIGVKKSDMAGADDASDTEWGPKSRGRDDGFWQEDERGGLFWVPTKKKMPGDTTMVPLRSKKKKSPGEGLLPQPRSTRVRRSSERWVDGKHLPREDSREGFDAQSVPPSRSWDGGDRRRGRRASSEDFPLASPRKKAAKGHAMDVGIGKGKIAKSARPLKPLHNRAGEVSVESEFDEFVAIVEQQRKNAENRTVTASESAGIDPDGLVSGGTDVSPFRAAGPVLLPNSLPISGESPDAGIQARNVAIIGIRRFFANANFHRVFGTAHPDMPFTERVAPEFPYGGYGDCYQLLVADDECAHQDLCLLDPSLSHFVTSGALLVGSVIQLQEFTRIVDEYSADALVFVVVKKLLVLQRSPSRELWTSLCKFWESGGDQVEIVQHPAIGSIRFTFPVFSEDCLGGTPSWSEKLPILPTLTFASAGVRFPSIEEVMACHYHMSTTSREVAASLSKASVLEKRLPAELGFPSLFGRVTSKSRLISTVVPFKKDSTYPVHFGFTLTDMSRSVKVVAWASLCRRLYHGLDLGSLCVISRFRVKQAYGGTGQLEVALNPSKEGCVFRVLDPSSSALAHLIPPVVGLFPSGLVSDESVLFSEPDGSAFDCYGEIAEVGAVNMHWSESKKSFLTTRWVWLRLPDGHQPFPVNLFINSQPKAFYSLSFHEIGSGPLCVTNVRVCSATLDSLTPRVVWGEATPESAIFYRVLPLDMLRAKEPGPHMFSDRAFYPKCSFSRFYELHSGPFVPLSTLQDVWKVMKMMEVRVCLCHGMIEYDGDFVHSPGRKENIADEWPEFFWHDAPSYPSFRAEGDDLPKMRWVRAKNLTSTHTRRMLSEVFDVPQREHVVIAVVLRRPLNRRLVFPRVVGWFGKKEVAESEFQCTGEGQRPE